jgi:beta-lactamase regulating signal transducer with metallopeptidase domain
VPAQTEVRLPFQLDTNTLFSTIVALWLGGVLILLTRLAAGCWRIRTLQLVARREPMSPWQTLAEDVAHRLRLRRSFRVVDSVRVATPTVVGWLRPIVLLPVAAMAGLSLRQVEAILAHELTHIQRHDFAVNLLQTFAETVLFYHPAVWWMSSRIRAEREHCCDDVASVGVWRRDGVRISADGARVVEPCAIHRSPWPPRVVPFSIAFDACCTSRNRNGE